MAGWNHPTIAAFLKVFKMFLPLLIVLQTQKPGAKPPVNLTPPPMKGQSPSTGLYMLNQWVKLVEPVEGDGLKLEPSVQNWEGWKGLTGGKEAQFPTTFAVDGNWKGVWDHAQLVPGASASPWPVRVFIFQRSEGTIKNANGLITTNRATIEQRRLDLILESLVRAKAVFQGSAAGALSVNYTTSQDQHPLCWTADAAGNSDDIEAQLTAYLKARFNGGEFAANDQLFRGPYRSVIVFAPMPTVPVVNLTVNGTPVTVISTVMSHLSPGLFTTQILSTLNASFVSAAQNQGIRIGAVPGSYGSFVNPFMGMEPQVHGVAGQYWVGGDAYAKNAGLPPIMRPQSILSLTSWSSFSPNMTLATMKDGKDVALSVTMADLRRRGGFDLPIDADTLNALKAGKFLNFMVKTKSADPLHICVAGRGEIFDVAALGDGMEHGPAAAVPADGLWHQVSLSLKEVFAAHPEAEAVAIGADPAVTRTEKISYLGDTCEFTNFSVSDGPAPDAVPVRERPAFPTEEAAAQVWTWKDPTSADFQANFQKALADPRDLIRLNALAALSQLDGSSVVASMISAYTSINPTVVTEAAKALAHQNVPAAWAFLVFATVHGINPRSRADAAMGLAQNGIVGYSSQIGALLGQKDWYARWAGATALHTLREKATDPDHLVDQYLQPFLSDFDPQVRLAAVEGVSPDDAAGLGKVLYAAVNDGADAVRLAAYEKVFQFGDAALVGQALGGFTDTSWWVRSELIKFAGNYWSAKGNQIEPSEAQRKSLFDAALKDANPQVEASALASSVGFIAGAPGDDEISSIGQLQHPVVQLALIQAAIQGQWHLSDAVKAALAGSVDPEVEQMAKKLP